MSSIDERVVELQFNNGQFEKGVQQSIGTLEKLKNSLNLEASANSLSSLEKAGKRFDLSNVSNNIQTVADRCSALGVIGDQVLRTLTSKAMTFSKNILSAIPNQIISGGKRRAQNINQAKFQLEGLLGADKFAEQWEQISKDINEGVRDTAYGFDAAAKVAAQLSASNVKFGEDMQAALRGISGVAAMTNSSYEEIGHIFTTVAGRGKLMTEQLNQFAYRGLNVAATLADALHTDEATLREMVTKGKIDFMTFATAMNDAFGEQAQMANKTFDGAMSNIRASLSRMGAGFATPAYEALRKVLVGPDINETTGLLRIFKDIEGIIKPLADEFSVFSENAAASVNTVLDSLHELLRPLAEDGNEAHLLFEQTKNLVTSTVKQSKAVKDLDGSYQKALKRVSQYAATSKTEKDTFIASGKEAKKLKEMLDELGLAYKDLGNGEIEVVNLEGQITTAWDTWTGASEKLKKSISERVPFLGKLLGMEKEEAEVAEGTTKTYKGLDELAQDVILGKYGSGQKRKDELEGLGYSYNVVQNRVNELEGSEKRYEVTAEELASTLALLGENTEETGENAEKTVTTANKITNILGGIGTAIKVVSQFATGLWTKVLKPFGEWAGPKILGGVLTLLSNLGGAILNLGSKIPDDFFDKKFEGLAEFFKNIGKSFDEFIKKVKNLDAFKKLVQSFKDLGTAISGFFSTGFGKISGIFGEIGKSAKEGINFDWALPIIENLSTLLTNAANAISAALGAVWPILDDFGKSIQHLFELIQNSEATKALINTFKNLRTAITNLGTAGFTAITEFFTNLGKSSEEGGHKLDWLAKVVETVSNGLTWFAGKVTGVLDKITAFVQTKFTSENFEKFRESIETFIEKTKESKPVQDLVTAFTTLSDSVMALFDAGFEKVSKNIESAGTAAEEAEPKFSWLSLIVGGVASILTTIANLANSAVTLITPLITSIGEAITNFFASEENQQKLLQLSTSFTNLGNAISGLFQLGIHKLTDVFKGFGEAGEESKEGLDFGEVTNHFVSFANTVSMVVDSITELINLVIANGGNFKDGFNAWFEGVDFAKVWSDFKTNLFAAFASIFNGDDGSASEEITRAGSEIVDSVAEGVEEKSATLPQLIAEKLVALPGQIVSSLKGLMEKVDTKKVFKGLEFAGLGVAGLGIGKFFTTLSKGVRNFAKLPGKIVKMFDSLKGTLKAYERDLNATALLKCAFAIGVLVASLWGLSKIDPGNLAAVIGVITPLAIAIGVMIYSLEKIKAAKEVADDAKGLTKAINPLGQFAAAVQGFLGKLALGINIALVAGSLVLLAKVLIEVSSMDWDKVGKAALIMLGVAGYLLAFTVLMKKVTKDIDLSATSSLFLMAAAILALSGAIYVLGGMELGRLVQGGVAVIALMVGIAGAAKFAGDSAQHMAKFGAGTILLAVGLTMLLVPLLAYSRLPWTILLESLAKMAVVLLPLAVAAKFASPAIYKLGLGLISISKAMLRMAAAVIVFAVGIAAIGLAVDIFVRALVDIGNVVLENIGAVIAGFAAFAVAVAGFIGVIVVLSVIGEKLAPGLMKLGISLLTIVAAVAIFVGAIALLSVVVPHLGDLFGGVIETVKGAAQGFKSFAEGLPVVGNAVKKFFGEGSEAVDNFSESLDSMGIDTNIKNDLVKKFAELESLSAEDYPIAIDNLVAYINGLDITDTEKQRILTEYINGLELNASQKYSLKVKGMKALIDSFEEDGVDFSKVGYAEFLKSVNDALNFTKEGGQTSSPEFHALLGAIEIALGDTIMSNTSYKKIADKIAEISSDDLTEEQKQIKLEELALLVSKLNYKSQVQSALQTAFDEAVTKASANNEDFGVAMTELQTTVGKLSLSDLTSSTLSNKLSDAANATDPEQRKILLNQAWLQILGLDFDEEGKQAFVEEIANITDMSPEEFRKAYEGLREKYVASGILTEGMFDQLYQEAYEAQQELQKNLVLKLTEIEFKVDEISVSMETGDDEYKQQFAEELKERYKAIEEAIQGGDSEKAYKLAADLNADFLNGIYSDIGLTGEQKETLANYGFELVNGVQEIINDSMNEGAKEYDFVIGDNIFGIRQGIFAQSLQSRLNTEGELTREAFEEWTEGIKTLYSPQSLVHEFGELGDNLVGIVSTIFPDLAPIIEQYIRKENMSPQDAVQKALAGADWNNFDYDNWEKLFFGDLSTIEEGAEKSVAELSGTIVDAYSNFDEEKVQKQVEEIKKRFGKFISDIFSDPGSKQTPSDVEVPPAAVNLIEGFKAAFVGAGWWYEIEEEASEHINEQYNEIKKDIEEGAENVSDSASIVGNTIATGLKEKIDEALNSTESDFDASKLINAFTDLGFDAEEIQEILFPGTVELAIPPEYIQITDLDRRALIAASQALGGDAVEGYMQPFANDAEGAAAASTFITNMLAAVATAQDSDSPSVEFEKKGKDAVEGYAQGWKNNEGLVTDAISTVMAGALQSAAGGSPVFSSIFGVTDDDSEIALAMSLLQGLNTASKEAGKTNTKPIFANMLKGVSIDTLPGTIKDLDESLQGLQKTLDGFKNTDLGETFNPIAEDLAGIGLMLSPVSSTLLKVGVAFSLVTTALLSIEGILSDSEGLDSLSENIPKFAQLFVDFCENVKDNAPELISAFTGMLSALGTELSNYIPTFSERAVELVITTIDSICYALINNTDKILVSLFKISAVILDAILSVVQTIVTEIPGLGAIWSDQIETLREALREKLSPEGAEEAALNYTEGLKSGLSKGFESATEAMQAAMEGKGFKAFSVVENAFMFSNGDLKKAVDHIKEQLSERTISPADIVEGMIPPEGMTSEDLMNLLFPDGVTFDEKAFESLLVQAGAFSMDGLASGITDSKVAENAMTEKARAVVTAWDNYTMTSSPSRLFMQKGQFLIQGLANGIKSNSIVAEGAMRVIAVKCLNAIISKLRNFNTAGRNIALQLANGLKAGGSQVLASARVLGNNAIDGIEDKLGTGSGEGTKGYELGKNFGEGFVNGINSKIQDVYDATYKMGKKAGEGGAHGEQAQSPSRVAIRLGNYFGEGFVIGINEFGTKVYSAAHDMATGAVEALSNPLSVVQDILSGELEVDPTIRPVMDLSEIQNGVGLINGMSPTMSVGIGSISASMNSRKTNPNEEVISAIHLLGDKLNQPSNIYNVNGITYDDGSNISDAVRGLIRAARVERRR